MSDLQDKPAKQPQPANPTMTRNELVAAAESIGMRFPAEQPQSVAWECPAGGLRPLTQSQYDAQPDSIKRHYRRIAAPPTREPVRLTDEQIDAIFDDTLEGGSLLDVARAIESAVLAASTHPADASISGARINAKEKP